MSEYLLLTCYNSYCSYITPMHLSLRLHHVQQQQRSWLSFESRIFSYMRRLSLRSLNSVCLEWLPFQIRFALPKENFKWCWRGNDLGVTEFVRIPKCAGSWQCRRSYRFGQHLCLRYDATAIHLPIYVSISVFLPKRRFSCEENVKNLFRRLFVDFI
jgi:hypothetical protein